jgi:predicted small secreted protein
MKPLVLILAALGALALSSCHTMEGMGRDMQKAGNALERTASH